MLSDNSHNGLFMTPWKQKQAAMLSYFSSLEYLTALHKLVADLINGTVEPVLDIAKQQKRDILLEDNRWGIRNTSKNWSNYGWPFLKDLQVSLASDIAQRGSGVYKMTAVNEYLYGMQQLSLEWMTPAEEAILNEALQKISEWATSLDSTVADTMSADWNDYYFAYSYPKFASEFSTIQKFRIRNDVVCQTGLIPEKTGVYISKDEPHAALQFAWSGKKGRKLRDANTFNDLGLSALAAVGRKDLWFNDQKMFEFATTSTYANLLHDDVIWEDGPHPALASSAVARRAFTKRKSDWYLVEPIDGEFDNLSDLDTIEAVVEKIGPRIVGGGKCVEPGFYFSPASSGSRRYFAKGDVASAFNSQYGETFWQWDANQD
jgi:hypothetical protein